MVQIKCETGLYVVAGARERLAGLRCGPRFGWDIDKEFIVFVFAGPNQRR